MQPEYHHNSYMARNPTRPRSPYRETPSRALGVVGVVVLSTSYYLVRIFWFYFKLNFVCILYMMHYLFHPARKIFGSMIPDTRWIPRNVRFPQFPIPKRVPAKPDQSGIALTDNSQNNFAQHGGIINASVEGNVNLRDQKPYRRWDKRRG